MSDTEQHTENKQQAAHIFRQLRTLKWSLGDKANEHDKAIVMISACILHGWDTRERIIGAMRQLDFNVGHAGLTLRQGTGDSPARHRWSVDCDGRYSLHPDQGVLPNV